MPAFEREYRYAPEDGLQFGVTFVSRRFNLGGFAGSNDSWQSIGGWFRTMSQDRLSFEQSMPSFEKYRQIEDPKERVRQIYRFLQEKTRYVQTYLGVDGWRPHDVNSIDAAKYGDCKDLSVYMVAMLEQARRAGRTLRSR